jgi:hypothetical protein
MGWLDDLGGRWVPCAGPATTDPNDRKDWQAVKLSRSWCAGLSGGYGVGYSGVVWDDTLNVVMEHVFEFTILSRAYVMKARRSACAIIFVWYEIFVLG